MIKIDNLTFNYKHNEVLKNINLQFDKGSIYGLLGENGVGKTTLLKLISGLLEPKNGSCMVDGMICFERSPLFLQNIIFMPDYFALPVHETPSQLIRAWAPFYPKYSETDFLHLMKEAQVDPTRKFKEMSCGQQKKSLLACILSLNTDYVLLDEPTNGLDIPSKADFRRLISQRSNEDSTIIISTHQVKDVENLIDPIIILSNEAVLLQASMEEITSKLYFEYGGPQRPEALYSEMTPSGFLNVLDNIDEEESQVNIEALFNTVLQNPHHIQDIFTK